MGWSYLAWKTASWHPFGVYVALLQTTPGATSAGKGTKCRFDERRFSTPRLPSAEYFMALVRKHRGDLMHSHAQIDGG